MKSHKAVLLLLFCLTLGVRLHFALSTEHFSSDNAYFVLRQVENIKEMGLPLFRDELAYGGRELLFNPLYMYILAFFNLFLPLSIVAKLLPNLFISSLVFLIYYIVENTAKNSRVALLGSVASTVIPIFFIETLNDISVYSLLIPAMLVVLYFFVKIRTDERYGTYCAIGITSLSLMHPASIILVLAFIIYYIFLKVEGLPRTRAEKEVMIFGTFFIIFTQFLIYRKALLTHGAALIWHNIPMQLLTHYFIDITFVQAIYLIGIIPLFYGAYIIYRYLFREKDYTIYFYISFAFASMALLLFKLIPINSGLMFLGAILVLLFAQRFKILLDFIRNTRFARFEALILIAILLSFFLTSLVPALAVADKTIKEGFNDAEISAFEWLKYNTERNATVLSTISEGHLITYLSQRKNVIDSNFLLIRDIDQRHADINTIYTTFSETEALRLLSKYNVNYLVLSNRARSLYGIERLGFYERKCFDIAFKNEQVKIYKVRCVVEEI